MLKIPGKNILGKLLKIASASQGFPRDFRNSKNSHALCESDICLASGRTRVRRKTARFSPFFTRQISTRKLV
jgi:hypothetical protein